MHWNCDAGPTTIDSSVLCRITVRTNLKSGTEIGVCFSACRGLAGDSKSPSLTTLCHRLTAAISPRYQIAPAVADDL